ncbi:hypothetical protein BGZ95_004700 [Linnemannia exigua]|uniref:MD-2-related lipid-recognition domain-containing protein n=1 Tax=Linnemannia exigua TaxID=604196 RepID=A0AAD4HAZ9_9FUNG|nr:hypothetical protein BGZ95_004700 [Linnemannia exigua]
MAILAITLVSADHHHHRKNSNKGNKRSKYNKNNKNNKTNNIRFSSQPSSRNHQAAFRAYASTHQQEERFTSCGNPVHDTISISSIQSSDHLCSGCKACVRIDGILKERIERGAVVRLQAFKFFFTVLDKTFDLCETLETMGGESTGGGGVRCPIEPMATGAEGLNACFPLDKSFPTGISASLKVTGLTAVEKKPMFCVQGSAWIEGNCPAAYGPGSAPCLGTSLGVVDI